MKVYVSAHVYTFMTFHNGFMFLLHLTYIYIYIYIYVIINRQGPHNIRNGILWAQTGHSTGTCTATVCG